MDGLDPLFSAAALGFLGVDALAILAVYAVASRSRGSARWGGMTLRLLAVMGLVVPVWTVLGWYRELQEAREWSRDLPVRTAPVFEAFATNSVALVTLGFLVLIAGIFLARRLPDARPTGEPE
ncbi:MAG TPA: hypothetical protein VM778_07290 [Gemmatimonadota bacterium]|nr:hypothetical protein [Gemmatimonadota bacterium]